MLKYNHKTLFVKNYELKSKMSYLLLIVLALRGLQDVYYAFSSRKYIPIFEQFYNLIVYASVLAGLMYILFYQRKVLFKNIILCAVPLSYLILLIVCTRSGYKGEWITEIAAIVFFCLLNKQSKILVFQFFYYMIQLQNIITLFMYCCLVFDIDIGITKVPYYTGALWHYYKWGIFAIYNGTIDRICGVFNEPGGLGTVCALLFIATFRYATVWEKMLLLVTIFFTFSFAGYLLIMIYGFIYIVKKRWRNVLLIIPAMMFFLALPNIDWRSDNLNRMAARFKITENGFAGDNRTTDAFDHLFDEFVESDMFLWGYGAEYSFNTSVASYKTIIVRFGLIGFCLIMLSWGISGICVSRKDKDCVILLLLFLLNTYQRPFALFNMYGYIVLFGGMEWIHKKERDIQMSILI